MIIYKGFKYKIYPNEEQRTVFSHHFGCVRFVYNYFLRERMDYYEEHKGDDKKGLSCFDTINMLVKLKKEPEYCWLANVNAQSLQQSLRNLDQAYKNFFNKTGQFPNFKKSKVAQSFRVPQKGCITNGKLNIPKCKNIKIIIHRPYEGRLKSITISQTATGKYFASILCEVDIPEPQYSGGEVGLDFGLKTFITSSDGTTINRPKFIYKTEKRLKRLQRSVSRKQKGSNSRLKAIHKLAVQHERVANQRKDFLHKTSRTLVRDNQAIYIEDLAIANMVKNHHLAKSISDAGWSDFTKMLGYKGKWYGCQVHKIDRFFPSSKTCNQCDYINQNLTLKDRTWQCPECNAIHDRDLNAAINIRRAGIARS